MEFRLLGAVTIVSGDRETHPASGRVRSLLACVAWQPRELVPDERLIDQIWDEEVPTDPRDALYTCAKRLRRALAEAGGAERGLVRLRGGYLLDLDPERIDVHRFRRLVREARQAGDDTAAACLYERALRLPAGTPLADVDSRWADGARTVLRREQLSARVAVAHAWLRAGRHAELVPDLVYLAEEHPLDEAITGLLMEALHRCGHQAEALDRYAGIRARLVEQLGDEPGPALRHTHQRLLQRNAGEFSRATQ
ncbi:DNA-binding SARP family transcriptional activator [Micromonospora luteifusca]|uniref:DNA-binding SARP family transcriptional activator n=1 Tax=Micromonospora luteifusca TaxID=709860 RepID=A0ABS2M1I4_9ACTN|nr:AfsR/SARP family transcriptional regulator [Micromonospora luteifusca]MBM7494285.1 DNA-binding SARP family transcriptional activator [Micromonospora luteifusca]